MLATVTQCVAKSSASREYITASARELTSLTFDICRWENEQSSEADDLTSPCGTCVP